MIKRILLFLLIGMAIALVVLWVVTGGIGRIWKAAGSLTNPIALIFGGATGSYHVTLPWEISPVQGPDISQYTGITNEEQASDLQAQTDELRQKTYDAATFGDPSPQRGQVKIMRTSEPGVSASNEYVEIDANSSNTAPVQITGWSLQSIATGVRINIPPAASLFVLGVVNPTSPVTLNPGAIAIVNTGPSPVGVSFRENVCSGYLDQYQTFVPNIDDTCPDPKTALPEIPENLQRYGASCFTYVQSLPSCRFPGSRFPSSLSPACQTFIASTYSYNGCVNTYQLRVGFKKEAWRLFLHSYQPLWNSEHDIIRLLDEYGRTVDVLKY